MLTGGQSPCEVVRNTYKFKQKWNIRYCPSGFPRDWAHIEYLRMKDYCCWHQVPDDFYQGEKWLDEIESMFKTAKPMMDFINSVIDDYE